MGGSFWAASSLQGFFCKSLLTWIVPLNNLLLTSLHWDFENTIKKDGQIAILKKKVVCCRMFFRIVLGNQLSKLEGPIQNRCWLALALTWI